MRTRARRKASFTPNGAATTVTFDGLGRILPNADTSISLTQIDITNSSIASPRNLRVVINAVGRKRRHEAVRSGDAVDRSGGMSMKTQTGARRAQAGGFLLEALIGVLIFSFGILGIVGLQAASLRHTGESEYRAEAMYYANSLISQMWTDDPAGLKNKYDSTVGTGVGYTDVPEARSPICRAEAPTRRSCSSIRRRTARTPTMPRSRRRCKATS